ncbi:AAA family ATPase [Flavobacterium sp. IB48]|uniref:AAA family ATPase n=1 Tax=Flavobacterium sp. IB48 TaxID=2779375 RepID=UPI0018E77779|nr:AAA family ATPase [Flavobacterium sp. IB48]MBJ2126221.1 AAA family ATPase [Flavobacterium sp. IB48]
MERAKLIVKNFGPLKDIDIEVREMVTFIGAQASGKSTLAKLLSIFEDENFRRDDLITFEDELKKYNIFSYLKPDTFILYDNVTKNVCLNHFKHENGISNKSGSTNWLNYTKEQKIDHDIISILKDYINYDLTFTIIKAEYFRKVLALFSTNEKNKDLVDYLVSSRNKLADISIDKIFELGNIEKKAENYISFYEIIINILPEVYTFDSIYIPAERTFLHLIERNVMGLLKSGVNIPGHILNIGNEYEKAIHTIKELPIKIIDKKTKYKREGQKSYIYHNENEKVDLLESASGLQSVIPILLLIEYSKSLKEEYNFNFVVEEPELNLYPKAQHELIKYLIKNCLIERKNLIITTHSPFILASINNLLLAHDKGQNNPKEVNKIIKKESWLNPKNFIAYELKNGKAKKIMNDKLGQISENMIDGVSDAFANEFDKLLDL